MAAEPPEDTLEPDDQESSDDLSIPPMKPSISEGFLTNLRNIVEEEFIVNYAYIDPHDNFPVFVIEKDMTIKARSQKLTQKLRPHNFLAVIRQVELFEGTGEQNTVIKLIPGPPPRKTSSYTMNIVLFILTVIAVLVAGWFFATSPPFVYIYTDILRIPYDPILVMIQYTVAIIAIIGLHELGHFAASRLHRIDASLPYFIPGIGYGTFGALIVQRSPPPNRDSLFDLGISGPIVGFIIAIIVVIFGLFLSPFLSPSQTIELYAVFPDVGSLPSPILFDLIWLFFTFGIPTNYTAFVHPVAFAGWVGFLITGLNFFPIGQLDGGHVSRALVGRRYHQIASLVAVFILFLIGYWLMALLAFFLFYGRHPGPVDDVSQLSTGRKIAGTFAYLLPLLLLPPFPAF